MRRNYPPVKRVREPLGAFCDHQFAVHAITLRHESGASSGAPSSPLCAGQPASIPWVAARVRGSIEPAFQRPSRPARCNSPRPATRIRPCPGLGGGGQGPIDRYRTRAFSWSLSKCTPHCRWSSCPISAQLRPRAFSSRSIFNPFAKDRASAAPVALSVAAATTGSLSTRGGFLALRSVRRGRSQ